LGGGRLHIAENFPHQSDQLQGALVGDAIVNPIRILAGCQHAFVAQDGQVLGNIALRRADGLDDILYADFLIADKTEYFKPQRVRDRLERARGSFYMFVMRHHFGNVVIHGSGLSAKKVIDSSAYYRILLFLRYSRAGDGFPLSLAVFPLSPRTMSVTYKLVLLRHGESVWNKDNRFTGWTDVGLTEKGLAEAKAAGQLLKAQGFDFDIAYTSVLKRAIKTLWLTLEEMDRMWLPIVHSWRLNERHYGALQGLNKAETAAKFGEEQVKIWRRAYDTPPPALEKTDPRYESGDPRYANLAPGQFPTAECLRDTVDRFLPYWHETIAPAIKSGQRVVVVAHGNSLRALIKYLDKISDADIVGLNIPTGQPLVYEFDAELKPLRNYYLGDTEAIAAAQAAVANQGLKSPSSQPPLAGR